MLPDDRAADRPALVKGQPASEDHWTRTATGYSLVQWIGHLAHNEGVIPMDVAIEIRAAIAAIEAEAAGASGD